MSRAICRHSMAAAEPAVTTPIPDQIGRCSQFSQRVALLLAGLYRRATLAAVAGPDPAGPGGGARARVSAIARPSEFLQEPAGRSRPGPWAEQNEPVAPQPKIRAVGSAPDVLGTSVACLGPQSARAPPRRLLPQLYRALASAMLLSGCTWFAPGCGDGGWLPRSRRGRSSRRTRAAIRSSPKRPRPPAATVSPALLGAATLSADGGGPRSRLLNNRGLQAALRLSSPIADAERVGQSLPPNPTYSWRRIQAGARRLESEMQLVHRYHRALRNLAGAGSEIAAERFHQAQLRACRRETLRVRPSKRGARPTIARVWRAPNSSTS